MSNIKEFWLDPNKEYTRNELRDMLSTIRPSTSFIVHYKGRKYIVHEGNCNVEDFICKLIPDEYERFTQISPSFITPRLYSDSDDSTRLWHGSKFKSKFKHESDFDEFLNTNLSTFHFNYLLPKSLSQKYTHNSFYSWDLSFLCDDDRMQEKLSDAYNEKQRRFEQEIIKEYKIALEAYEAEEATKKQDSDSVLGDNKYTPWCNFFISLLFHAIALILYITKLQKSTNYFWMFIAAEICFAVLTVALFPDCYYDDDFITLNESYASSYEILMLIGVAISMILIFVNFPQFFNIGGKIIMRFLNR